MWFSTLFLRLQISTMSFPLTGNSVSHCCNVFTIVSHVSTSQRLSFPKSSILSSRFLTRKKKSYLAEIFSSNTTLTKTKLFHFTYQNKIRKYCKIENILLYIIIILKLTMCFNYNSHLIFLFINYVSFF